MKYLNFADRVLTNILFEIVIVIIDLSGSMNLNDWKPSRKSGAIKANKELIRVKAQQYPEDLAGIIIFGDSAKILHEPVRLTEGAQSLYRSLSHLPDMGYTNFTAALELAETCLFGKPGTFGGIKFRKKISGLMSWILYNQTTKSSQHIAEISSNDNCLRRIIMLTDGGYNEGGSPMNIADRLKDKGTIIDVVGIGGNPDEVEVEKIEEVASRNPDGSLRYCFIGDQDSLIKKYESLAHHIRPV
jgi:hypothetical protein